MREIPSLEDFLREHRPLTPPPEERMLEAFRAVGFALSARAILLLSLVGAFVLAIFAMEGAKDGVWILGVYCVLVVLPMVFLETYKRR